MSSLTTTQEKTRAQLIFQDGLAHFQQGRLKEADDLFYQAHQLDRNNVGALNLLGIRAYQKNEFSIALNFLNSANLLAPHSPHTLSNLSLVHIALSQFQEALNFCDLAIEQDSSVPEAHNNRGNALKGLKRNLEALDEYKKAIELRPNYSEALSNTGIVLLEEGMPDQAIPLLKQATLVNPDLAEAFNSLANALTDLGNYEDAFYNYERALQINPNYLDACLNFGNSLKKGKQYQGAIHCYEHALKIKPDHSQTFYLLGELYYDIGNPSVAKEHYAKSLVLDPQNIETAYGLAIAQIPKIYKNSNEINASRASFSKELDFLKTFTPTKDSLEITSKCIARHPFYLAYQEEINRELLTQFGKICTQQALPIQKSLGSIQGETQSGKKIRIGIVSKFFCDHPVWYAITKGWVNHLNTNQFELLLFNTGGTEDEETALAKLKVAHYFNCGKVLGPAAQQILDEHLDVILYPEIGMDTTSKALACLRLAPLQLASWGHPETTGLPNIDYFLSSELLEPLEAEKNYSEKLILLPNLGTHFDPPHVEITDPNFLELDIDETLPILLCAGSPSKYLPSYDSIFVEIAKRLGKCQFVFFSFDENLSVALQERLRKAFLEAQLNVDQFIRFIPFQKREVFFGLMKKADIYLDTIGFSGFNTAMQALFCNLPVITIEGRWMRGRLASGILNQIGLSQLICKTEGAYINLAVEMIQNKGLLQSYKSAIAERKMGLFNDLIPIRALEDFLSHHTPKK